MNITCLKAFWKILIRASRKTILRHRLLYQSRGECFGCPSRIFVYILATESDFYLAFTLSTRCCRLVKWERRV